ncbi:MAG: hypothetical protein L3J58_06505 [Emcibacter sp.]|nr:hypothetical protein [Emcibacter sp.]
MRNKNMNQTVGSDVGKNIKIRALIIAGFMSVLLITGIVNLSYANQQRSVLEFGPPPPLCSFNFCSLL